MGKSDPSPAIILASIDGARLTHCESLATFLLTHILETPVGNLAFALFTSVLAN